VLRLFIVLGATLTTGCAFIGIESNATRRIDHPHLTTEKAKLNCDELDRTLGVSGWRNPSVKMEPSTIVTKEQLQAAWGMPDEVQTVSDGERWTYRTRLRWNGLWGLILVVPVPLLAPTGREAMIVEFSGDTVQTVEARYQVSRELGCGLVLMHGGGWSCSAGEPNHYYGLHSSFCGSAPRLSAEQATEPGAK